MRTIRQVLFIRREWTEGDDASFVAKVNEIVEKRDVIDIQWSMSGTQPVGAILHCIDEPEDNSSPIVSLSDKSPDAEDAGVVRGEEKQYDEEDDDESVVEDDEEEF